MLKMACAAIKLAQLRAPMAMERTMTNHTDHTGVLVYLFSLPNNPRSGRPPSRLFNRKNQCSPIRVRRDDIPKGVEGSSARLGGSLNGEERNETDKRPQDECASLAHPVGHDGQERRTADSWQVVNIAGAEDHDDVEYPTQGTGTDDSDENGDRSGDSGLLDFFTDVSGWRT